MLIDTHAHLYWKEYEQDLDEVIQRSIDAGVTTIINVGVDVELSKKALIQVQGKLANIQNFSAYSTIGIHPHEVLRLSGLRRIAQDKHSDVDVSLPAGRHGIHEDIEGLEKIYQSDKEKVIAVGECGLDYLFDPQFTPSSLSINQLKDLQRKLFQAQIDLAKKLNLPLIVHCRDDRSQDPQNSEAWDKVMELVKDRHGILHCYSGLEQTTRKAMDSNFLISFAGNITYPKNEYLKEAVKILPLEKIVLETDCPFLPPQSKRGQRNEPSFIVEVANLIAKLKGLSFKEVANQTTLNVKRVLKLN